MSRGLSTRQLHFLVVRLRAALLRGEQCPCRHHDDFERHDMPVLVLENRFVAESAECRAHGALVFAEGAPPQQVRRA